MRKLLSFLSILGLILLISGCQPPAPTQGPMSPSNLQAVVVIENDSPVVNLTWKDNSDNEQGFKIYRKAPAGDWEELGSVGANVTSYQDTPPFLTLFEYKVTAYNNEGENGVPATLTGFKLMSTFEEGTEGWRTVSWKDVVQDSTTKHTGIYSLKTTTRQGSWDGPSKPVYKSDGSISIMEPDKTYYISIWACAEQDETLKFTMKQRIEGDSKYVTLVGNTPVSANTWTNLIATSVTFTSGVTEAEIYVESTTTCTLWVDDMAIIEK